MASTPLETTGTREFVARPTGNVRVLRRTATWRWIHWLDALAIGACAITGLFIAQPYFAANNHMVMAWDRSIHLYAAAVLDVSVFVIAYLYLFSRAERGIDQLKPTRENVARLKEALLNVVTLNRRKRFDSAGPDPLNALFFALLHVLVVAQLLTGLQMYVQGFTGNMSSVGAWWPALCHFFTDWTVPVLGGNVGVRMTHYALTWFILSWVMLHVYYEWWRTSMWKEGDIAMMFGGYKHVASALDASDEEREH
ncbi:MAG TPA: cytochrome b/b6 domain-containing protein [Acidimicrobiales bacterium]|nr:cytochrome b/b6 domain-containing protein [Acidimicrobiales bacterium]